MTDANPIPENNSPLTRAKQCCRCKNVLSTKTITLSGTEPRAEKGKAKKRVVIFKIPVCTRCHNILQIPRWVSTGMFIGGMILEIFRVAAGLGTSIPLLVITIIGMVAWVLFDQDIIDPMPAKIRKGQLEYYKK